MKLRRTATTATTDSDSNGLAMDHNDDDMG